MAPMMTRNALLAAIVALLGVLLLAPAAAGESLRGDLRLVPALKRSVVVSDEFVRIGDLIVHAGAAADVPVFRAPDLGTTGKVSTAKILDVIRPHHLFGVDVADIATVEVTRAGRSITRAEIEARILRNFASRYGLGDARNLTLSLDREVRTLTVEPTATGELQVAQAHYEARTGRFDITLELPDSVIAQRQPLRFTGSLVERIEVVVLTRSLQRGDIVKASDLTVEHRQKNEMPVDGAGLGDSAVGLAARQALRAGQVLRRGDLMKPELVKRDDMVTLIYASPGIILTTRGKALEAGAEGDLVSAVNVQSKRTVQGIVTGAGQITLVATTPRVVTTTASIEKAEPAQDAPIRGK